MCCKVPSNPDGFNRCYSSLLLCTDTPRGAGLTQSAVFWAGNYSAFPLSPFHLLDEVLAAERSQLARVPKRLQTNAPRHHGAPSHAPEPALTQSGTF